MKVKAALTIGFALAAIGMAAVVTAVIVPGLFFPGVWLIDAAFAIIAVAAVTLLRAGRSGYE